MIERALLCLRILYRAQQIFTLFAILASIKWIRRRRVCPDRCPGWDIFYILKRTNRWFVLSAFSYSFLKFVSQREREGERRENMLRSFASSGAVRRCFASPGLMHLRHQQVRTIANAGKSRKKVGVIQGKAKRALFEGKHVKFGNKVSFSERKTRRKWQVNAQTKTFFSDALGENVKVRVSTHAIRCIKKAGSFDNYILRSRYARDSPYGENMYQQIKGASKQGAQ